jgi:biopolymer transport protein ExbB/TolQ|tara:strand:+ start:679 stop:2031 length:1353 start_codon:yes stop_codon:yes gene_type:complete
MLVVAHANHNNIVRKIFGNLGWPLFWGMAAWVGFYALVHRGVIVSPFVNRYFAGHPVEYIEMAMFFVGMAALALQAFSVAGQYFSLDRVALSSIPDGGQAVEESQSLLDEIAELPSRLRDSMIARRLEEAIETVRRRGTADGLDEHLKYLSDIDADRRHDAGGLVRIIVWATPMLGFLGTVIGITMALGGLGDRPEMLVDAPKDAVQGLLAGLSVAFDTTAVALSLSMVLMFVQFLTDQVETQLSAGVDQRVDAQLVGRFCQLGTGTDPNVASIRRMAEQVVNSSDGLVRRQTELWQATIDSAHQQWNQIVGTAGLRIEEGVGAALDRTLDAHSDRLIRSEEAAAHRSLKFWEKFQQTLTEYTERVNQQQQEFTQQNDIMLKVVAGLGQVSTLEDTLNKNLSTLAGAQHFQETVMSLAAAIQLLNARLGNDNPDALQVSLKSSKRETRAA